MDKIKQWSVAVSSVAIISGLLISVLPDNMHKKTFKLITSVILIYAFMLPVIGTNDIDFNIDRFLKDNYRVSENIDKYAMSSVISSAEKAIENLLSAGADEENISCRFECECILKDGQISVKRINVVSFVTEKEKAIIYNLAESLGLGKSIVDFTGEYDDKTRTQ